MKIITKIIFVKVGEMIFALHSQEILYMFNVTYRTPEKGVKYVQTQLTFTCSKVTIETLEEGVKYNQS